MCEGVFMNMVAQSQQNQPATTTTKALRYSQVKIYQKISVSLQSDIK